MTVTDPNHPAHLAGKRSRDAVAARDKEAISGFWDKAIAPTDSLVFNFETTYQCGDEEANVGNIVTTIGGHDFTTHGVFTYRANEAGQLVALRAFWEAPRTS